MDDGRNNESPTQFSEVSRIEMGDGFATISVVNERSESVRERVAYTYGTAQVMVGGRRIEMGDLVALDDVGRAAPASQRRQIASLVVPPVDGIVSIVLGGDTPGGLTPIQDYERVRRAGWRRRILARLNSGEHALRPCAACGASAHRVLCASCSGDHDAVARWRERIYIRQRASVPVPLDLPGGACASQRYPAAPTAPDAVRLRCPLRRSPDGASDVCASASSARCAVP
jgi:hypothetical protein